MGEGAREPLRKLSEGTPGAGFMPSQALVFAHQPARQVGVHMFPDGRPRRSMELAIVLLPAPENRIEHSREIGQLLVALQLQMPPSDGLPHGLAGRATDRWREVRVYPAILGDRLARSERVAEERELDNRVILLTIDVLAVHDLCLGRMQLETALPKAFGNAPQCKLRLLFALAMDNRVIRVSAEPYAGKIAFDP